MRSDQQGQDEPANRRSAAQKWDRRLTRYVVDLTRPFVKGYFRSAVLCLEHVPPGAALMVANHSGGLMTIDMSVVAVDYYRRFGYQRPLYALGHDNLFRGPVAEFLERTGVIRATPGHAAEALAAGGLVLVFPGGDYDDYRPTTQEYVIGFGGRTGYVTTAIQAGVPIVPAVSIGGTSANGIGAQTVSDQHSSGHHRLPVRCQRRAADQRALADKDHHAGTATDRHRRRVRGRSST